MNNKLLALNTELQSYPFHNVTFAKYEQWRCVIHFEYDTFLEGRGETPDEALDNAINKCNDWVKIEKEPALEITHISIEEGKKLGIVKSCPANCGAEIWCVGEMLSCPKCGAINHNYGVSKGLINSDGSSGANKIRTIKNNRVPKKEPVWDVEQCRMIFN